MPCCSSRVVSGKAAAPKAAAAKKAPVAKKQAAAVPESQLKKRKTVDALKAKQAAAKVTPYETQHICGNSRMQERVLTCAV